MRKLVCVMLGAVLLFINQVNYTLINTKTQKNSLISYKNHIDGIRKYMDTFSIQKIEFPVQKAADNDGTFVRKGLLTRRPNALGTVIVCHGYTQSKHEAFFFRTLFPYFNVLAFDFRAHGELTQGQYSTIGRDEMFDVKGAVDFVKNDEQMAGKPVIGFGFSMGAVSLLEAQAHFKKLFDLLVLDSPFDSSSDCMSRNIEKMLTFKLFGATYRLPGKGLMMKCLYNQRCRPMVKWIFKWSSGLNPNVADTKFVPVIPLTNANDIDIPCMFITCEKDTKVTVDCVQRLYQAVHAPYKRLWITSGIKHCGSCLALPEQYSYRVNKFIHHVLDHSWHNPAKIYDHRSPAEA